MLSLSDVFILFIAVIGGATALSVVTSRNVVHSALYLVITLLSVAGVFLMLGAEFLAWAQVLVYVGAVVVLILFGLMLTRAPIGPTAQHNQNRIPAAVVSLALFVFLVVMIMQSFGNVRLDLPYTSTAAIGEILYVQWAFPFMVLGFFLTVALIGSIVIARREEGEGPEPPASDVAHRDPTSSDTTGSPGRAPVERQGV